MNYNLRKLIRESIESSFLCEVKVVIDDVKKRGFADELGKMYKNILASLKPVRIYGKLGIQDAYSSQDESIFDVTLTNGDMIHAVRNTNPAFGTITINGTHEYTIFSQELFKNKFPDLIKKYYLKYKTAKAGIQSI